MKVELLSITPNAEEFLGIVAAECYDADTSSPEKNLKRAIHCTNKGHLAVLRFAHAVFNVSEITRICSHQFVRSKHLDFLQKSQRYTKPTYDEQLEIEVPPSIITELQAKIMNDTLVTVYSAFDKLIDAGVKKEDARYILPNMSSTALNVVGNFQAWKDFIKLRKTKEAQYEIRMVATEIERQLNKHCPNIFPIT